MQLALGIEIGGTKLQMGVGQGGQILELERADVNPDQGAQGILSQIETIGRRLQAKIGFSHIGVGFGGPVNSKLGTVTTSHQIPGWDHFPLGPHLEQLFQVPVKMDNDCNVAALGEARCGAGRNFRRVFYVTVGTGIGGGFVLDGRIDGANRPAIAEIGHLRPGIGASTPAATVESIASGWGIARQARREVELDPESLPSRQLLDRCNHNLDRLTTKQLSEFAAWDPPHPIAQRVFAQATSTLGWGIAQMITLMAPDIVIVGGGVSLTGSSFFDSLRKSAATYVFPPLAESYQIVPAQLGENVVVCGALLLSNKNELDHVRQQSLSLDD